MQRKTNYIVNNAKLCFCKAIANNIVLINRLLVQLNAKQAEYIREMDIKQIRQEFHCFTQIQRGEEKSA